MKMTGRRESSNVDDRRGLSSKSSIGGMGIGGIIIMGLIAWLTGGNPLDVILQNADLGSLVTQQANDHEFTEEEQQLAKFSSQILAGTEDVWTELFQKMGRTYQPPKMCLYTGSVQTSCGNGLASMGPFYCSGDQTVYIDLSFFMDMKSQLGADGDFAYAYVIAHEVGHHVQYLLGDLDAAHNKMARLSDEESNKVNVRLELQADFYAGVWANNDNRKYASLEEGDVEEAIHCAQVIGDNYLQEKAQGYSQPETFTHGTSEQRMRWLKRGIQTGDPDKGDTFSLSDSQL